MSLYAFLYEAGTVSLLGSIKAATRLSGGLIGNNKVRLRGQENVSFSCIDI